MILILFACESNSKEMNNFLIFQTSDLHFYSNLLKVTSEINSAVCDYWGVDYMYFEGIKEGNNSVHAVFNRIYLLKTLLEGGEYDWVLQLDADAFLWNFEKEDIFQKVLFSRNLQNKALVFCGGPNFHQVNSGVGFYNLRHPMTKKLLDILLSQIQAIAGKGDIMAFGDDQDILQNVLFARFRSPENRETVFVFTGKEKNLFNENNGVYVRQITRQKLSWNLMDLESQMKERIKVFLFDIFPFL